MGFAGPTSADLQDAADRLGLHTLSMEDALTMRAALDNSVTAFQRLDAMPDPVLPGADTAPRSEGHAPTEAENPYGA